ncbi:MAG: hypothetical protein AB7D51_03295 [Desulfovibrionaceae bacterium]
MTSAVRQATALQLISSLRSAGSWCGETHLQKAMYFLEKLGGVPSDLGFILYKHGPYSFDFHDIIGEMRTEGLIEYKYNPPYGPQMDLSDAGKRLLERHSKNVQPWHQAIDSVAKCLGGKGVVDLEKLGTALMVYLEDETLPEEARAKRLVELKPHIDQVEAAEATRTFDTSIRPCFS